MEDFKAKSFDERKQESERIHEQYPERRCVIVGRAKHSVNIPDIEIVTRTYFRLSHQTY